MKKYIITNILSLKYYPKNKIFIDYESSKNYRITTQKNGI